MNKMWIYTQLDENFFKFIIYLVYAGYGGREIFQVLYVVLRIKNFVSAVSSLFITLSKSHAAKRKYAKMEIYL